MTGVASVFTTKPMFRRGALAAFPLLLAAAGQPALAQSGQKPPAGKPAANGKPAAAKPETAKPAAGKAAPAGAPGGAGATAVASFGDWNVFTAQSGRSKICYALTQPKERLPKALTRDPAYLFVSFRPAENVKNEVALVLGFAANDTSPAQATIGKTSYTLLTKEQNAWLKNPAEEGQAIATMSKGQALIVKAKSRKGNDLTDRYSLSGFGPALERAKKECS